MSIAINRRWIIAACLTIVPGGFLLLGLLFVLHAALVFLSTPAVTVQNAKVTISGLVDRVRGQAKLVVADQALTVTLDKSDSWYLFNRLYLGTTVVKLRIEECRVQYYIRGEQVAPGDFQLSSDGKNLTVTLPHPRLDTEIVDIPSDPDKWQVYKSSGWARFDKNTMEAEARKELRKRVVQVAQEKGWTEATDRAAKERLKGVLAEWMGKTGLEVEVEWR